MGMGDLRTVDIVGLVVSLVVMGLLLPIGIGNIANFSNAVVSINGTDTAISTLVDGSVITLVAVLIPIIAVISIVRRML